MKYLEIKIEIFPFSEEAADIITAEIENIGFESFMAEDPYLSAYITEDAFVETNLKDILDSLNYSFSIKYSISAIKEENWNEVWESNFDPIIIQNRCTIKASFHKELEETEYNIIIDPKMAFGTGHHQTTSLMVEAILSHQEFIVGKMVLDMGCGTGVLAILAHMTGANPNIYAIEIDNIAVDSTKENAILNNVDLNAFCGDASLIEENKFDVIFANINRNILLNDMSRYYYGMTANGKLFLSGFYREDIPLLVSEAKRLGFEYISETSKDEWALLILKKNII